MDNLPPVLAALEPDQLVEGKQRLPRRKLSRWTTFVLVLLRIYVVCAVPIVIYALFRSLRR
jgi:hypothetical protein